MNYFNLFLGLAFVAVFFWLLWRNAERKGFVNALFRIDTIIGLGAGIYLVTTSVASIVGG